MAGGGKHFFCAFFFFFYIVYTWGLGVCFFFYVQQGPGGRTSDFLCIPLALTLTLATANYPDLLFLRDI